MERVSTRHAGGWRCCTELLVLLAIVVSTFLFASWYSRAEAGAPMGENSFWLRYSLGIALDKGAVGPTKGRVYNFLDKKMEQVSPEDFPPEADWGPISAMAEAHLYLVYAAGLLWRWRGIGWDALAPLYGVLFAATCAAAYGIFRLVSGRWLSLAGTLLFALTPIHLAVIPHVRDYSKAPFILGVLFVLGLALRRRTAWNLWQSLGLGAALGGIVGLGLGFRQDLQIYLLPALVIFLFFLPGSFRETWKARAGACVVMVLVVLVTAWPVFGAMRRGGANPAHNVLGGLSEVCSDALGYEESGAQLQPVFLDSYIAQTLKGYAREELGMDAPFAYMSNEYEAVGMDLLLHYARVFPYNLLLRGAASFRTILSQLPLEHGLPGFPMTPTAQRVVDAAFPLLYMVTLLAPVLLVLLLVVVSARSLRLGLALCFLAAFLGTYPALQYHPRHAFQLAFLPWWLLIATMQFAVPILWRARHAEARASIRSTFAPAAWRLPVARVASVALFVASGLMAVYGGAWLVQRRAAGDLLDNLRTLPRTPLNVEAQRLEAGGALWTLLKPAGLFPETYEQQDRVWQTVRRYLAVEFAGTTREIPLRLQYESPKPTRDYTYDTSVRMNRRDAKTSIWFYFPVYSVPGNPDAEGKNPNRSLFTGLALPEAFLPNVRGIHLLEQAPPFPLYARVDESSSGAELASGALIPLVPSRTLRTTLSLLHNQLDAGDMETWDDSRGAPMAAQPPQAASTITRETVHVRRGGAAVKQVWTAPDINANPTQRFGVYCGGLQASQSYDIVVDAWNAGASPVGVAAYLVVAPAGQTPQLGQLSANLFTIAPAGQYQPYLATITLPPALRPDTYLLLTPVLPETKDAPPTVYWDSWRVAVAPAR